MSDIFISFLRLVLLVCPTVNEKAGLGQGLILSDVSCIPVDRF